jgi:hypothetical protein
MYQHLLDSKLSVNKTEKKLTQLLSTHGEYMSFGMYELWFLIDECHFVIESVRAVALFSKHDRISNFVNYFFQKRITAKTTGENALCKNILNSSYGSDGMNTEKITDVKFLCKEKALHATVNSNFISSQKIKPNLYLVQKDPPSARCNKPLQTAYATLSNAKYWFNLFVYKFMYACLDTNRFHFIIADTDSYMWAVAGTGDRGRVIDSILGRLSESGRRKVVKKIVPHFEEIIKDREFYEANYGLFFPKKKSLLTLEYEHCCKNLLALPSKNYYCDDGRTQTVKLKGVSTKGNLNQHLNESAFRECITDGKIIGAENYVLRMKNHEMTKQLLRKTGLSGVHTKMVTLANQACLPFIYGISADKYSFQS